MKVGGWQVEDGESSTYSIVARAQHCTITSNCDTCHAHIILRDKLVRALILSQIPDPHVSSSVTANEFSLIWVDDHIIDWNPVCIVSLYRARPCVPDLDRSILGASYHPFAFAVESNAGYIARVTVEGEDCIGICGFDVVELHRVVTGSCEVAFVG